VSGRPAPSATRESRRPRPASASGPSQIAASDFGVYIHWPYCAAKCPYCDFNSHVRAAIDERAWTQAVVRELEYAADWQGDERPIVSTIFFGGGTPSLMAGRSVAAVIDSITRLWRAANDVEITLEANPASADANRFADYCAAGVNRLSLGVQALNDADLKALGRLHSAAEARSALSWAQRIFPRVSLDLIYARPDQSVEAWRAELGEALSFDVEHLSLYQLTIEPATPFAALYRRGALRMPDEERAACLYEATQELTSSAGLPAYEISNHARAGAEARHNLLYWRYGSYVGAGPGAHGRLDRSGTRYATATERSPERWSRKVAQTGHGLVELAQIEPRDAAREHLIMNLRLAEGLDLAAYRARWGMTPDEGAICELEDQGLVAKDANKLTATLRGRLVLNRVIDALAP
jgi:oxygen-independent coproporphyrinogen-3 oxidase